MESAGLERQKHGEDAWNDKLMKDVGTVAYTLTGVRGNDDDDDFVLLVYRRNLSENNIC